MAPGGRSGHKMETLNGLMLVAVSVQSGMQQNIAINKAWWHKPINKELVSQPSGTCAGVNPLKLFEDEISKWQ